MGCSTDQNIFADKNLSPFLFGHTKSLCEKEVEKIYVILRLTDRYEHNQTNGLVLLQFNRIFPDLERAVIYEIFLKAVKQTNGESTDVQMYKQVFLIFFQSPKILFQMTSIC